MMKMFFNKNNLKIMLILNNIKHFTNQETKY